MDIKELRETIKPVVDVLLCVAKPTSKLMATDGKNHHFRIPYMDHKQIDHEIAELVNEKKIEGISNVNDESDRSGSRIGSI
jgi:hypothetical protein